MAAYFGTDGIRGEAHVVLSEPLAFRLGQSLAALRAKTVVIGMDTRESGEMLARGVEQGARSMGIDVMRLGVVPTPMLAWVSQTLECFGVMITASHNPYRDNGLKVFDAGRKLFLQDEATLEAILQGTSPLPPAQGEGVLLQGVDPWRFYWPLFLRFLRKTDLRIGLDFANGATYRYGPKIFRAMSDHVHLIGVEPNGTNINEGVGSTHIEALRQLVLEHRLDLGFSFDGDGDRVLAVDKDGSLIDGDQLIYFIAVHLQERGMLKDSTVVLTKMSNLGILKALGRKGIAVHTVDVGDKYVIDALDAHNWSIGGENSGHIINRPLLPTGDGVLNAAYILSLMEDTGRTFADVLSEVRMYPDKLVNLKGVDRSLAKHEAVLAAVNEIREELGEDGKVLVRASGTEPLIRISVSAETEEAVARHIDRLSRLIRSLAANKEETK
jgi:phosphoglucosamine mutase